MNVERLPGGRVTAPVRVGDAVHRTPRRPHPRALEALRFFERAGWDGAPRVLSEDASGAEVLAFIAGRVPWQHPVPGWAATAEALRSVAQLVRQFHDLTAGTLLAGSAEVLCHHDLAPNNTVYREVRDGGLPFAFIDWDMAGPGRRIEDVAHVCWTWLDLGPGVKDVARAAGSMQQVLEGYGASFELAEVIPVIIWWQDQCWRGIEQEAHSGDAAMAALVADGTADSVRTAAEWTKEHAAELAATAHPEGPIIAGEPRS